MLLQVRAVCGA